jgi:hypothetical protein
MPKERKALLVRYTPGADADEAVAELNRHLADEWVVVASTAMGGAATGGAPPFVALVVLEREEQRAVRGFVGSS